MTGLTPGVGPARPPLLLFDLLRGLGLPEQLLVAAVLVVAAFYLRRLVNVGRWVGAVLGSVAGYAAVVLAVLAVGIALGWLDPATGAVLEAVGTARDVLLGWLVDRVAEVVP